MANEREVAILCETVNRLMDAEDWHGAVTLLQGEAALVRSNKELSSDLGWAYFKQGRLQEAVDPLRRAVELKPEDPTAHWALGVILSGLRESIEAEEHLLRALSLRDTGITRLCLANLYVEQGRIEEAEGIHVEGLRLQPAYRERHEAYANFLSDMGREEESAKENAIAERLPSREERKEKRGLPA